MLNYYLRPRNERNSERNFWNEFLAPVFFNDGITGMKTDITENEDEYILDIELPGLNKEDVKIALDDGNLTVTATRNSNKEEKDEDRNYIRRERYYGSTSRSWYVGNIDRNLIKASFNNGILTVKVPKEEMKPAEEEKFITIE